MPRDGDVVAALEATGILLVSASTSTLADTGAPWHTDYVVTRGECFLALTFDHDAGEFFIGSGLDVEATEVHSPDPAEVLATVPDEPDC